MLEDCSETSSSMFLEHASSRPNMSEFYIYFSSPPSFLAADCYCAFLAGVWRSHPRDNDLGTIRSAFSLSTSLPPNSFVLRLSRSAVYAFRTWLDLLSLVSSSIESTQRQSGSWGCTPSLSLMSSRLPLLSYDSGWNAYLLTWCYLTELLGLWYCRWPLILILIVVSWK